MIRYEERVWREAFGSDLNTSILVLVFVFGVDRNSDGDDGWVNGWYADVIMKWMDGRGAYVEYNNNY